MNEKLLDIVRVTEIISVSEVNQYLALGWILLDTTSCSEDGEIKYSLGWLSTNGEIKAPDPNALYNRSKISVDSDH